MKNKKNNFQPPSFIKPLKPLFLNISMYLDKNLILKGFLKKRGAPWDGDRFSLSLGEGNGAKTAVFEKRKPLSLG